MKKYVTLDLEMCNRPKKSKKVKSTSEIIEIGAVLLDEDLKPVDEFKTYVSPTEGTIDSHIHKLTGITKKDLDGAPEIEDALHMLSEWLPEDSVIITWSDNDERQIRRETERKGIEGVCDFFEGAIDCQAEFGKRLKTSRNYGLTEALVISGIDYDVNIHDALVDARNTALLFAKLEKEKDFQLSPLYIRGEVGKFSYNPFADLLDDFTCAV